MHRSRILGTTRLTERRETRDVELLYDTAELHPSQFLPQDLAIWHSGARSGNLSKISARHSTAYQSSGFSSFSFWYTMTFTFPCSTRNWILNGLSVTSTEKCVLSVRSDWLTVCLHMLRACYEFVSKQKGRSSIQNAVSNARPSPTEHCF
jgi:hypothetical protein